MVCVRLSGILTVPGKSGNTSVLHGEYQWQDCFHACRFPENASARVLDRQGFVANEFARRPNIKLRKRNLHVDGVEEHA
jgi:hypothetical protein